jgi:frataxin-like iron-binding protein CyaY
LTTDEYHDLADQYIDTLVLKLEEMAEDAAEKLEVEYSVCHTSARPGYTLKAVALRDTMLPSRVACEVL